MKLKLTLEKCDITHTSKTRKVCFSSEKQYMWHWVHSSAFCRTQKHTTVLAGTQCVYYNNRRNFTPQYFLQT